MFSGGTGSTSITRSLLENPAVELTNIINCYDDGHSTGRLRAFIPGYLGPSDVRKNITNMMPTDQTTTRSLKALFEYRYPVELTQEEILHSLETMQVSIDVPIEEIQRHWRHVTLQTADTLRRSIGKFLSYYRDQVAKGNELDLHDASLGNIFMTGEYIHLDRSFNKMIQSMSKLCEIRGKIANVSGGDNLYLIGLKEDGTLLHNEASLVGPQSRVKLKEIYLFSEPLSAEAAEQLMVASAEEREEQLAAMNQNVNATPECIDALEKADIIIFAPGTQHSSLLPSYLTRGMGEAIAKNNVARKIFVCNICEDHEIPEATANSLIDSCVRYLNRRGELAMAPQDYITDVLVHKHDSKIEDDARYLFFNFNSPEYEALKIKEYEWEEQEFTGLHNGLRVATHIQDIVQQLKNVPEFFYTISIIVPGLNEEKTVAKVLSDLKRLDFSEWGLSPEVVYIDGGSTDQTMKKAQSVQGVKVYRIPEGQFGKGAAVRYGLQMTVSDLVVVYPADGEYITTDILRLLNPILTGDCDVTLGARNLRPHSKEDSLGKIYKNQRLLYFTSLFGGNLLSLLTLFFYRRFISDPLTSIRAFKASKVRHLKTHMNGFEYDQEVLGMQLRQDSTIFEIPVSYRPRTREEGKKMKTSDGLKSLIALIRTRYRCLPKDNGT